AFKQRVPGRFGRLRSEEVVFGLAHVAPVDAGAEYPIATGSLGFKPQLDVDLFTHPKLLATVFRAECERYIRGRLSTRCPGKNRNRPEAGCQAHRTADGASPLPVPSSAPGRQSIEMSKKGLPTLPVGRRVASKPGEVPSVGIAKRHFGDSRFHPLRQRASPSQTSVLTTFPPATVSFIVKLTAGPQNARAGRYWL